MLGHHPLLTLDVARVLDLHLQRLKPARREVEVELRGELGGDGDEVGQLDLGAAQQLVVHADKCLGTAGLALAGAAAEQLPVYPPGLEAFGGDHM